MFLVNVNASNDCEIGNSQKSKPSTEAESHHRRKEITDIWRNEE